MKNGENFSFFWFFFSEKFLFSVYVYLKKCQPAGMLFFCHYDYVSWMPSISKKYQMCNFEIFLADHEIQRSKLAEPEGFYYTWFNVKPKI